MVRGEAGILRTDLWSLGNNARAFWKILVMTGADYSAPVRGMRMAEGKMSPPPPSPPHVSKRSAASVVLTENNLKTALFRENIYFSRFL